MTDLPRNTVIVGDARKALGDLPENSVDCVVTSPPYFRLRNYGRGDQIGLESSVDGWVDELRLVARGLARVLKPTGTLWLNLGDTYSAHQGDGAPAKSLVLGPERLALALMADGWILRNKIIWSKPNPMPSSVRDRLSCTWEVVYCFARSRSYYFDLDAMRVPHAGSATRITRKARRQRSPAWSVPESWRGPRTGSNDGLDRLKASGVRGHSLGKNPGDVWVIPTAGYRGAHHAVFPEKLVQRPVLAGCPEQVCSECGVPWRRQKHRVVGGVAVIGEMAAACECGGSVGTRPGVVLDPFMGAGTTAIVAEKLGREWLGIELNPMFAEQANARIADARSLTTEDQSAV